MPGVVWFATTLVGLGAMALTFTTSANSLVQLRTDATMRGQVMAIYMAVVLECTPFGAPVSWLVRQWSVATLDSGLGYCFWLCCSGDCVTVAPNRPQSKWSLSKQEMFFGLTLAALVSVLLAVVPAKVHVSRNGMRQWLR